MQSFRKAFSDVIVSCGSVYHDKYTNKNNTVRLKAKIIDAFGDLSKSKTLFYRAELYPTFDEISKRINELRQSDNAIPILLFLFK